MANIAGPDFSTNNYYGPLQELQSALTQVKLVSNQAGGKRWQTQFAGKLLEVFTDAADRVTMIAHPDLAGPGPGAPVLAMAGVEVGAPFPYGASQGGSTVVNLDPYGLNKSVTPAVTVAGPLAVPAITQGARVAASWLITKLGPAAAGPVIAFLRTLTKGALVKWASLPGWLRLILTTIGFSEGIDFIFDDDGPGADTGLVPSPIASNGTVGGIVVVGTWEANGVKFYRLSDGRLAVQNSKGRWKIWRAPRPIVLTSGGAGNLRTFLKADRALDRQAKRLKSALGRRTTPPKPRCATCGYVRCRCHSK